MADKTLEKIRQEIETFRKDLPFMSKSVQKETKSGIAFIEWILNEITR